MPTEKLAAPPDLLAIADTPAEKRTAKQTADLRQQFRKFAPALAPLRDKIAAVEKSRRQTPTVPVLVRLDDDKLRTTRMMIKGDFLNQGEAVEPGVLSAFHALPENAPRNRLGLAEWLVNRDNPLTARVAVNRYWAQFAKSGDPNGPGAPAVWPQFDPEDDKRLQLDATWEVLEDFRTEECAFWRKYHKVE